MTSDNPTKSPSIAEALRNLPALLQEQDRQRQAARRETAKRMTALYEWMEAHGVKPLELPMWAQHLIWILDSGEPIHPKAAERLNAELLSRSTGNRDNK